MSVTARRSLACMMLCIGAWGAPVRAEEAGADGPFINTWLVLGTFDNGENNSGFERDWIGEATAQPVPDQAAGGKAWVYFDDRLFSRNYDDYQDLFSFFHLTRGESAAAKVAYAHVYVYSERMQIVQLRVGADNEFKAWMNGTAVAASGKGTPARDATQSDVKLPAGWNRLLIKVGNQQNGRFGFYARLCDAAGHAPAGVTYSLNGGEGALTCLNETLPAGFIEWPYVAADAAAVKNGDYGPLRKPGVAMHASPFVLSAGGGMPPYRWKLAEGSLPEGLALGADGSIRGTVARTARIGEYAFRTQVTDGHGAEAACGLGLVVRDRPNRWYEEARLTALIHNPEAMPAGEFAAFADLMKQQGYGLGMVISYNNGEHKYRWPSVFEPQNPVGDLTGRYKRALEDAGLRFGMYVGNFDGDNHGGDDGAIVVIDDLMRRFRPAALWFDWAGWDGTSLDALYSVIRSHNPDTVIVLNGVGTASNGDWDIVVLEGWGAWGRQMWDLWPGPFEWPKRCAVESWRLVADPTFDYTQGIYPDWREYLRVQISLIGEGFVANIDHSPCIRQPITTLRESIVMQCHRAMARWANPPGVAPLHESYTRVNPGPLPASTWGYNTINLAGDAIYLHMLATPYGKTGMPSGGLLSVGPIAQKVRRVRWMNQGVTLPFKQSDARVVIETQDVMVDPVDTILKIELAGPYSALAATQPESAPATQTATTQPIKWALTVTAGPGASGPVNLGLRQPSRLLDSTGQRPLPPSAFHFARYGVDGASFTVAQGGNEWAWTYEVDLQEARKIGRVVIHFGAGWATEYNLLLSADGEHWTTAAHVTGCTGGAREHLVDPTMVRYVRVRAIKPDGPDQEGVQMSIAELEVYAPATATRGE